jgi:hypothetical protein
MKSHLFCFALLLVTAIVASAPALAAGPLTRTFVSSTGVDTNPCTIAAPCASFAAAYAAVAADGIVAALDPGKYGPLTITGPVTINGNGWAAITATAAGNGITVNAVSGNVTLTGLEIDGARAAYNGIVFNTGSSLNVTNCVLGNFIYSGMAPSGVGVLIEPTSGIIDFSITNTTVTNSGGSGIAYYVASGSPGANGIIDHVALITNVGGISIEPNPTASTTVIAVSNSAISNGNNTGIYVAGPATLKLSIDNSTISGNGNYGIYADLTGSVLLGRSVITGNGTGVNDLTSPNTFYSYGNNQINLNNNDLPNPLSSFATR